jgi:anti-sigma regulatory factor (Ser/Thr protein kinase)
MTKLQKSFTGHFEILEEIGAFMQEAVSDSNLSESDRYALQLVVDEAATNIIEYAYRDQEQGTIDLTINQSPEKVVIILHDEGQPFDPDGVIKYQSDVPLEEMKERGAGLHLIKTIMDDVTFKFDERKGNTLLMVKVIE